MIRILSCFRLMLPVILFTLLSARTAWAGPEFEFTYGVPWITPPTVAADERAYDVELTADGGYVMVGSRSDGTFTEVYAVRVYSNGNIAFNHTYRVAVSPSPYSVVGFSIDETLDATGLDSGYVIVGHIRGVTGSVTGQDALMLKISNTGALIWWRVWDGAAFSRGDDVGNSVRETSDLGYIMAGGANFRTVADCSVPGSHVGGDLLLVKTNALGATQWSMVVSHPPGILPPTVVPYRHVWGEDVQQTTNGGYAVVGNHHDPLVLNNYCSTPFSPTPNERLYFLRVVMMMGNPIVAWSRTYPDPGGAGDRGYSIRELADGYIMVGQTSRTTEDVYVVRTDAAGGVLWARVYDGGWNERGYSIRETAGGFVIAGIANVGGNMDALLIEIDAGGGIVTSHRYGGTGTDEAYAVRRLADGRNIAAGFSNSFGTGGADYDMYLLNTSTALCDGCPGVDYPMTKDAPEVEYVEQPVMVNNAHPEEWNMIDMVPDIEQRNLCNVEVDPTGSSFQKHYTNWADDFGNAGTVVTHDGIETGYAIVGNSSLAIDDPSIDCDAILQKMDLNGDVIWTRELYTGVSIWGLENLSDTNHRLEHGNAVDHVYGTIGQGGELRLGDDLGFIVAGDVYHKNNTQDTNALLYLVDQNGNLLWTKSYGRRVLGNHEVFRSVCYTADGGFIAAGYSNSRYPGLGAPNGFNFYVVKTDPNGTIVWDKVYGGHRDDLAYHIEQTDDDDDGETDDGYIIVGCTNSFNQVSGPGSDDDLYVIKIDASGTVQWSKVYKTTGGLNDYEDIGFWITELDDDNDGIHDEGYVIAGYSKYNGSNGGLYVLRIDNTGTRIWDRLLRNGDPNLNATATSVVQRFDPGLVLAGWTATNSPFKNDQSLIVKMGLDGTHEKTRSYPEVPISGSDITGQIKPDHSASAFPTQDGGFVAFGTTCSYVGVGKSDLHVVKTTCADDLCGSELYEWSVEEPQCQTVTHNTITREAEGFIEEVDGTNDNYIQYLICELEGPGVTIQIPGMGMGKSESSAAPSTGAGVTVSAAPTPLRRGERIMLQITAPEASTTEIVIADALGRVVDRKLIAVDGTLEVPVSTDGWGPGVYLIRVVSGGTSIGTARVVVE